MSDYSYHIETGDDQGTDASRQIDERVVYVSNQPGTISTELGDSVKGLLSREARSMSGQTNMEDWA
jgi:uncharacterized protein (UPF0218 family)